MKKKNVTPEPLVGPPHSKDKFDEHAALNAAVDVVLWRKLFLRLTGLQTRADIIEYILSDEVFMFISVTTLNNLIDQAVKDNPDNADFNTALLSIVTEYMNSTYSLD